MLTRLASSPQGYSTSTRVCWREYRNETDVPRPTKMSSVAPTLGAPSMSRGVPVITS